MYPTKIRSPGPLGRMYLLKQQGPLVKKLGSQNAPLASCALRIWGTSFSQRIPLQLLDFDDFFPWPFNKWIEDLRTFWRTSCYNSIGSCAANRYRFCTERALPCASIALCKALSNWGEFFRLLPYCSLPTSIRTWVESPSPVGGNNFRRFLFLLGK